MAGDLALRHGSHSVACLLVESDAQADRISSELLESPERVSARSGFHGYAGECGGERGGERVSVQASGVGAASLAYVVCELALVGVRSFVRVGECAALGWRAPRLGELVCPVSAVPGDGVSRMLCGGEASAPTASFELLEALRLTAERAGEPLRVCQVASSDLYHAHDPDHGRARRWAARGASVADLETAALFTLACLRSATAASLLVVSDTPTRGGERRTPSSVAREARLLAAARIALEALSR